MLAVIQDLVSVQMIASLGGDVKPLSLSSFFVSQIEGNVQEPTLLFEKRYDFCSHGTKKVIETRFFCKGEKTHNADL